eukprot:gene29136-38587_t
MSTNLVPRSAKQTLVSTSCRDDARIQDNSAVVIISNLKKCKHFIMVMNYVREQLEELGLSQGLKIKGELNNADLHTKNLRDKSFTTKADNILGSPTASAFKAGAFRAPSKPEPSFEQLD